MGLRHFLTRAVLWRLAMWKIVVGFVVFAGLALYVLNKGGDIDMGGEKHGGFHAPSALSWRA